MGFSNLRWCLLLAALVCSQVTSEPFFEPLDRLPFSDLDAEESAPEVARPGNEDKPAQRGFQDSKDVAKLTGRNVNDMLAALLEGELEMPGIFTFIKQSIRAPWWKGENVCVSKEERNETVSTSVKNETERLDSPFLFFGSAAFETCKNLPNKYICTTTVHTRGQTKTTETTYKCCPHTRRNLDKDTCEPVDMKPPVESAKALDAKQFAETLDKSVKKSMLEKSNVTIFAPSDKAVAAYWKYMNQKQAVLQNEPVIREAPAEIPVDNSVENEIPTSDKNDKAPSELQEKLLSADRALGHIVDGVFDIHDLDNEEILNTVDGLPVRINMYPSDRRPIVTANCAVIKSANHPLTNDGLMHVTDGVLPIVKKSIKEILEETPELNSFKNMLEKSGLLEKLGEPGNYTVFAPNEEAISAANNEHKFLQKGQACVETVLKTHIIPRTLCSGAFGDIRVMTRSLSGNWLTLERGDDNSLVIARDGKTTVTDIVGNNGVVHIISKVIIPASAEPVTDLLEERNHTTWLRLVEKAGLKEELEETSNRTIFVPSEEALAESEITGDNYDPEKLKEIIRYHISDKSVCSCQMTDNMMLPSVLPGKDLRINTYESGNVFIGLDPTITVQCGMVLRKDQKACNFMVHEVDRVLKPATQSVLGIIKSDDSYSKLREILQGTNVEHELEDGSLTSVTFLAPTDEAFSNLTKEEMEKLQNKTVADQLLRRHILTDVVCCNGIGVTTWPFTDEVITASGASLNVRRKNFEQVMFGGATTTSCDNLATNGLVHSVDKVMMPRPVSLKGTAVKYIGQDGAEIVLYGI